MTAAVTDHLHDRSTGGETSVVPTPDGFVELSSIAVGDTVFGSDGRATRVVAVGEPATGGGIALTFSDGASTVAASEQLWLARDAATGASGFYRGADIVANLVMPDGTARWSIDLVSPVEFPCAAPTAVDPLTFGQELRNGLVDSDAELVPYLINTVDVRRTVLAGLFGDKSGLPASAGPLATAACASLIRSLGGVPAFERAGFGQRIVARYGQRRHIVAATAVADVPDQAVTVEAADGLYVSGGAYILTCGSWGRP